MNQSPVTQCDATKNVRYQELEPDEIIADVLDGDKRHTAVVKRYEELESRRLEVQERLENYDSDNGE